jgi:DNA-binding transcriptional regulator YbjK
MRVQNEIQRMGVHVEKYNMEFINDAGIVHTMDGNVMAVQDRYHGPHVADRPQYENLVEEYTRGIRNDEQLRELLNEARSRARAIREPEPEEPEDFLDEKDMEL